MPQFPRIPAPGVRFDANTQGDVDDINWNEATRRVFDAAVAFRATLPFMGAPTDAQLVAIAIELAHETYEQVDALREALAEHTRQAWTETPIGAPPPP